MTAGNNINSYKKEEFDVLGGGGGDEKFLLTLSRKNISESLGNPTLDVIYFSMLKAMLGVGYDSTATSTSCTICA